MLKKILFLCLILLSFSLPSQARDYDQEIENLKREIISLQNEAPLGIRKFIPCSRIFHYGSYTPINKIELQGSGEFLIYMEPKNFFTKENDGQYETWLTEDMQVLDESGNVIFNKKDALNIHLISKSPLFDIFFQNSMNVEGLPPGKYKFKAILYDQLKNQSASAEIEFSVK